MRPDDRTGADRDDTGARAVSAPLGASLPGASARTREAVNAVQVAGLAADAARAVPGVAALQPRLRHLPRHWTTRVWAQATGRPVPDTAGVTVRLHGSEHPEGPGVAIEITLATGGPAPAAAVVAAVQRRVAEAVRGETGLPVHEVAVLVCDIAVAPAGSPSVGPP